MTKRTISFLGAFALVALLAADSYAQNRPATQWIPASSSNYTVGRQGTPIQMVVIHVAEGTALGAANYFANPVAHASAHYAVAHNGTIYECVHDSDTAWHAGNHAYNLKSIGIEHEGYTYQNTWTDTQYRASAALTRWVCLTYHVPMDRQHIIGHNEVPDPDGDGSFGGANNHTDPGPYFNWAYYMSLVTAGNPNPNPPPNPNPNPNPSPNPAGLTAQQVTTSTLNVRTGAGTGYSIIGTVHSGQIYASNTSSNGWYQIWFDNRTGWCSGSYLTRRTNLTGCSVTAGTLNVRTGPGTGNAIVGTCSSGERFIPNASSNGWLRICYRGQQYWISAAYTTAVQF